MIFLYAVRESVLVAFSVEYNEGTVGQTATFDVYIFFSNLADSVWFAILLAIAAGFW